MSSTTTTPTWNGYKDKARVVMAALLDAAVYLMPAEDDCDDEVEVNAESADDRLADLEDAWRAISPNGPTCLISHAIRVSQGEATQAEVMAEVLP